MFTAKVRKSIYALSAVAIPALVVIGVDSNFQKVVKGLVLLAAVIFDVVSKRRAIKSLIRVDH